MSRWGDLLTGRDGEGDALRAEDARVRELVETLLIQAADAATVAEATWRRERIPPPTRAAPFAPPEAFAGAQALERMARDIKACAARLAHQPTPGGGATDALRLLLEQDKGLIEAANRLRLLVEPLSPEEMLAQSAAVSRCLAKLADMLAARGIALL